MFLVYQHELESDEMFCFDLKLIWDLLCWQFLQCVDLSATGAKITDRSIQEPLDINI